MTGDRPTTPGWHCHRCRSTSCRQRADSDTDHVGRVEYRPLLLTQPSSVSWLWSHTHWCPSQRPQEVMRVDGSADPTMPKNPAQYVFRYVVGKSRHRAHTESQREESGESQFLGSLWRATLSREAWMPIWGLSTESMKPWPPPGGGRGYGTKRRRWCGGTGVPGGHDTHRPFTNRKAAPGEGTVIRARVGRPIPFRARSAQAPSTSLPLGA